MKRRKYNSTLEHLLTFMLERCMLADGTILHLSVVQQFRPYWPSALIKETLKQAGVTLKLKGRLQYYTSDDILAALEREKERMQGGLVTITEEGDVIVRRKRVWDQPQEEEEEVSNHNPTLKAS